MGDKICLMSGIVYSLFMINVGLTFAQQQDYGNQTANNAQIQSEPQESLPVVPLATDQGTTTSVSEMPTQESGTPQPQNEPEMLWVWGEVTSVDPQNKTVTLKYLDYETDQEKEITITAEDKTTFENVTGLDEIAPKNTLSIDYIAAEGKNIAKNISLEKSESPEPETQEPAGIANTPQPQAATVP